MNPAGAYPWIPRIESIPPALAASDDAIERQGVPAGVAHVELIEPDTHIELLLTVFLKQVQCVIEAGPFGSEVETEATRPSGQMGGGRVEELPSVNRSAAEIAYGIGELLNPEGTDPSLTIHKGGRNSSDGKEPELYPRIIRSWPLLRQSQDAQPYDRDPAAEIQIEAQQSSLV